MAYSTPQVRTCPILIIADCQPADHDSKAFGSGVLRSTTVSRPFRTSKTAYAWANDARVTKMSACFCS